MVFPELAESEDERIRRNIIAALKGEGYYDCDLTNECIAWVEKQESVASIVERCKTSWYNEGKIAGMAEGLSDEEKYQQGWHDALEKQGNQKAPSLSEKEIVCLKRTLDFVREEHNSYIGKDFTNEIAVLEWLITHPVLIYSSELQQNQGEQKPAWSEEDERICHFIISDIANDKAICKYELSKGVCDEQINWLKSLKDRIRL